MHEHCRFGMAEQGARVVNMSRKLNLNGPTSDMLDVIDDLPSDKWGKSMILVQCTCGRVNAVRASSLTRKPSVDAKGKRRRATRSCGCLEKAAFKTYIARKANEIPLEQRVEIWTFLRQKHNWKKPAVQDRERDGFDVAARVFNFDRGTISEVYRDIRLRFIGLLEAATWHDWLFRMKSKRAELGELPNRVDYKPGEFAVDDVALSEGHIVGKLTLLIGRAHEIQGKWAEFKGCENREVKEIMDLAEWTIERVSTTIGRRSERLRYVIKKRVAARMTPK
jgi:hypothetical protein